MIVVHVQHFLNDEGVAFYPAWLKKVSAALKPFAGFVALAQLTDVNQPNECHLSLRFDSVVNLRVWAKSQVHDELLDELEEYTLQKRRSWIYDEQEVQG